MNLPQTQSKRLSIRSLIKSDYSAWKAAHSTMLAPLNEWDRTNRPAKDLTPAKFGAVLKSQAEMRAADKYFDFAIFEKSTGKMIGRAGIMDIQRGLSQSAYLGYTIFNPHWNRGYGKESVRKVIEIAFRQLKLHRIEAGIEPGNRRSIRLARSLGLRKEGLKKRAVFLRNQWVDLGIYSATSEDFGLRWKGKVETRPH